MNKVKEVFEEMMILGFITVIGLLFTSVEKSLILTILVIVEVAFICSKIYRVTGIKKKEEKKKEEKKNNNKKGGKRYNRH